MVRYTEDYVNETYKKFIDSGLNLRKFCNLDVNLYQRTRNLFERRGLKVPKYSKNTNRDEYFAKRRKYQKRYREDHPEQFQMYKSNYYFNLKLDSMNENEIIELRNELDEKLKKLNKKK